MHQLIMPLHELQNKIFCITDQINISFLNQNLTFSKFQHYKNLFFITNALAYHVCLFMNHQIISFIVQAIQMRFKNQKLT